MPPRISQDPEDWRWGAWVGDTLSRGLVPKERDPSRSPTNSPRGRWVWGTLIRRVGVQSGFWGDQIARLGLRVELGVEGRPGDREGGGPARTASLQPLSRALRPAPGLTAPPPAP